MIRSGICFTLAILLIAVAMFLGGCSKKATEQIQQSGETEGSSSLVGKSLDAGKSAECRAQLSQLRQAIESYKVTNEVNPNSLAELGLAVGDEFFRCPVSGQSYVYDPYSGIVRCANPQHAQY